MMGIFEHLRSLLSKGATDKISLYHSIGHLPHPSEIPADVIEQIVDLVPQISELLSLSTQISDFREYHFDLVPQVDDSVDGELNRYFLYIESVICQLFGHLGTRAQAAVPALLAHTEKYPRFKINTWAIGKIGGPGVVRRLIKWTDYRGPHAYDERCHESIRDAIGCLGVPAIQELLDIANPSNTDAEERTVALLNLVENTAYPPRLSIPLIASELDRIAGAEIDPMCHELLRECLIGLGNENAPRVVTAIEPLLLARSEATNEFLHVLSELGTFAIPLLKKAVEASINAYTAIESLVKIGGEGLDYVYTIITTSKNQILVGCAVRTIPLNDVRSLEVLKNAIWRSAPNCQNWGLIRRFSARRLREFTDHQAAIAAHFKRLCYDSDLAIRFLGDPAIQELVDTASPSNADAEERTSALLRLVENPAYPPEDGIPLIASELDRHAGSEIHRMSRELLRDRLILLGNENPQSVVAAIEPWLLLAESEASKDFIQVLSTLGTVAIPLLKKAVDASTEPHAALAALAKIGSEGLDYLYTFITTSQNQRLLPVAVRSILLNDERSLEVLKNVIETLRTDWRHRRLLRKLAVRRLGEFSDYQLEIAAYLKQLHGDSDPSVATLADVTLTRITDKENDRVH